MFLEMLILYYMRLEVLLMHKTDIPYINKSNAEMFVAEF